MKNKLTMAGHNSCFGNTRAFLLFSFFLLSLAAHAQDLFLNNLQQQLANYKNAAAQEKVFLHTDKSFYLTGETLWFKAYVVKADTHQSMDLSKVFYVELLDDGSKPALQAMIELKQGLGDGSFVLPPSLNSGNYVLRAYTAWMKNRDAAFFFQTPIQIVNTARKPDWAALEKKKSYTVHFFPEGGNLLEGFKTKLGFQLADQYGKGVDGDGIIVENSRDTVARFRPLKFGLGSFVFAPKKGAVYKAAVRLPDGEFISSALPPIQQKGYAVQLDDADKEQLQITTETNEAQNNQPVYLLAHTGGETKFASAKLLTDGKAVWLVDKAKLGNGITVFTVFNAERRPVCERLYFKKPSLKMAVDVRTDAKEYNTRSKVSVDLTTQASNTEPVQGNLSMSVFLLDSLQGLSQPSIEEYFWLTSELKGNVESAAYYFGNDNDEVRTASDNLMLTHGWRRFSWQDVEAGAKVPFPFLPEYEGAIIKAKVVNKSSGEPVPNVLCYLSVPGEEFYVANAVSNSGGELTFVTKNIYGPVEMAVQPDRADSTLRIDLLNAYSDKPSSINLPSFSLPERRQAALNNRHLAVQVANNFAEPVVQQYHLPAQSDTSLFYGKPDGYYALDDYTRFPTMEEVMREVVAEVHLQKERDTFHYTVLNLPYRVYFNSDPLVLFDGLPLFNTNKIIAFDPLKVKKIEVVARKYFWGNVVSNGIVSYITYDGSLANFDLDPGVVLMEYNGLQMKREFYSPVYATPEQQRSRVPDRRNVLLWQPSIQTDGSGKKRIEFYTSDTKGVYAIRLQGIGNGGEAGSKIISISVK